MKYVGNKSFMMFNNKMMELMELIKFCLSVFQISNSTNKKLPEIQYEGKLFLCIMSKLINHT